MLIREKGLKEGGDYFKVSEINHIKFQVSKLFVFFNNENEPQNLNVNKPKKMKSSKYQQ